MRHGNRFWLAVALTLMTGPVSQVPASEANKRPKCDGIEVAGICDPFVPGTMIQFRPGQPILVASTWHNGPAEIAGVCPGDEILSVNGILASENSTSRILREIVSESPSSIHLRLRRGTKELGFEVARVRESTLARLSKQRFLRASGVEGGTILVPLDETHEEISQLEKFQARIESLQGFKTIEGLSVPSETPEEQVEKLAALRQSDRLRGVAGFANNPESYTGGFSAFLLKDPEEVRVYYVLPGSPAHRAGLFPGDSLVEFDGKLVEGLKAVEMNDLMLKPDERRQIKLKVIRAGTALRIALETQKAREFTQSDLTALVPDWEEHSGDDYVLGILALHAENPREAMVAHLEFPSPALDAGVHSGDLLLAINGIPLKEIDRQQLAKLLAPDTPSKMTLEVSRVGKKMTFRVTPVTYRTALASIGRRPTKVGPVPQHCPETP